jgi:hypothetical protein
MQQTRSDWKLLKKQRICNIRLNGGNINHARLSDSVWLYPDSFPPGAPGDCQVITKKQALIFFLIFKLISEIKLGLAWLS